MQPHKELLQVMVYEIVHQATFALWRLAEAEEIERSMPSLFVLPGETAPPGLEAMIARSDAIVLGKIRMNMAIHDFLTHAANVSKIFYPTSPPKTTLAVRSQRDARGQALRKDFGVTAAMQISNRKLRNSVEHFDNELQDWFVASGGTSADMVDLNRAPFGWSSPTSDLPPQAQLRNFGSGGRYTFLGNSYDLFKARDELISILATAEAWLEAHR
jgi:hypothetical protein